MPKYDAIWMSISKRAGFTPISSPYSAPIVFIKTKTGKLLMMVDYRELNHQTMKDVYPLPRIDDLLDKLSKAMCLIAIDLARGYHQV